MAYSTGVNYLLPELNMFRMVQYGLRNISTDIQYIKEMISQQGREHQRRCERVQTQKKLMQRECIQRLRDQKQKLQEELKEERRKVESRDIGMKKLTNYIVRMEAEVQCKWAEANECIQKLREDRRKLKDELAYKDKELEMTREKLMKERVEVETMRKILDELRSKTQEETDQCRDRTKQTLEEEEQEYAMQKLEELEQELKQEYARQKAEELEKEFKMPTLEEEEQEYAMQKLEELEQELKQELEQELKQENEILRGPPERQKKMETIKDENDKSTKKRSFWKRLSKMFKRLGGGGCETRR
ncbi:hypothetical protein AMEX_G4555 [Astyanax mexicanus]|uniref:Uncharacterized protein n=1 Tax=Astyanax mexicanus TaxID=7994 RepID=A0A8T2MB83_ASTMX|nr:hypothetical protein AMEX_G4555 [Astyanax mexicanus]